MRTNKNKNNKKRNISLPIASLIVVCAILYMSTVNVIPSVHADETSASISNTADVVSPSPTVVPTPTPEPTPKYINLEQALEDDASTAEILELIAKRPDPLYLEVDLYNQIITVYELDEEGEYKTVIKQLPCSGGMAARQTESKTPYLLKELYKVNAKYNIRARDWGKWGWVHYVTDIYEVFLFHSVLYKNPTFTSYIHDSYTNITFPASHGCIRLLTEDTQWIFYNLQDRDIVDLTKNEANPELSQYLQPMPPKDYNCVATRPPDTLIRSTSEPEVDWAILNHKPKDYNPGSFK